MVGSRFQNQILRSSSSENILTYVDLYVLLIETMSLQLDGKPTKFIVFKKTQSRYVIGRHLYVVSLSMLTQSLFFG